jgi:hypothetical protein
MIKLLSCDAITIINAQIQNQYLHCGLITVDRFTPTDTHVSDIESGTKIKIRLPRTLANQPMMTSLVNQQIQIIQEDS